MVFSKIRKSLAGPQKETPNAALSCSVRTGCQIEFIGPAGVGKSTLFKSLTESLRIAGNRRSDLKGLKKVLDLSKIDSPTHTNLLEAKLSGLLATNYTSYLITDLMSYFLTVVSEDMVMSNLKNEKGFLLEEGLLQNFSQEIMGLKDDSMVSILNGRAIIYLRPVKPSTVVDRIRKRQNEGGHTVPHHIGKTDEELMSIAKSSVILFDVFTERLKALKIPFFEIVAEDNFDTEAIKTFLKQNNFILENDLT